MNHCAKFWRFGPRRLVAPRPGRGAPVRSLRRGHGRAGPGRPQDVERQPRPGRRVCGLPAAGLRDIDPALSRRLPAPRLHGQRVGLDPVRRDQPGRGPGHRRAGDPADDHRHAGRRRQLVHQRPRRQGPLRGHVRPGAHPSHRRRSTGPGPPANSGASPACRWAAGGRSSTPSAIRSCSPPAPRSARRSGRTRRSWA